MIIGIVLFAFVGLVFGYGVRGLLAWAIPLSLPLAFAVGTVLANGFDDLNWIAFIVGLAATAGSVVAGRALATRGERETGRRTATG